MPRSADRDFGPEEGAMRQLLLQSRGTDRVRGPQNYERSIRRGIRLVEIQSELGSDLDVLTRLYPDGVARLWGSTPTQQVNNAKVRALRDRRVGDDVLFYADKTFYARTRILHLFRNPQVAKWIWHTDEDGQTWEHIMALAEVQEFAQPVPAEPILRRLGLPVPLRSLTLVSAADYAHIASLLPAASAGKAANPVSGPGRLRRRDVFAALRQLIDFPGWGDDESRRDLLVMVLGALAQVANGEGRTVRFSDLEAKLASLRHEDDGALRRPGLEQAVELLEIPVREAVHVRDVWEMDLSAFPGQRPTGPAGADGPTSAGFTSAAAALLDKVDARGRAVALVSAALAADAGQSELLAELGLAGYDSAAGVLDSAEVAGDAEAEQGPARRIVVQTERIVRRTAFAEQVKRLHGHRCQVCGLRLETRNGYYSEAAHIRGLGRPHNGPDDVSNVLCLCPNHHVQFDAFVIFVDENLVVRRTRKREEIGPLRQHPHHRVSQEQLKYHRRFCGEAK